MWVSNKSNEKAQISRDAPLPMTVLKLCIKLFTSDRISSHKLHEMPEVFCSQWRSSQGEPKKLKICMYLIITIVCQKSSRPTFLRVKGASVAKSGETKKNKFHEMLDLLCFYSKNLEGL